MKLKEKILDSMSGIMNSQDLDSGKDESDKAPERGSSRRNFFKQSVGITLIGGTALGMSPLTSFLASGAKGIPPRTAGLAEGGYGELFPVADLRDGVQRLALPEGFSYFGFGFEGDMMSDGNTTPKAHDGMAALPLPNGNVRLIRNHEDRNSPFNSTVKGDSAKAYDPIGGGGTTSLELTTNPDGSVELVRDFVSLNGTIVNCAGGPTPWGSWLTCEETTAGETQGWGKDHGFIFEVPGAAEDEVTPEPLTQMGRFVHEAVAVDPVTGIVYETEDRGNSGFYRFLPDDPQNLSAGGQLQMLAVRNQPNYNTRTGQIIPRSLPVVWVDIDDPNPVEAEFNSGAVFDQGFDKGGAVFGRLEGCWFGNGSIFFNSTSGGDAGLGQVWEYRPSGNSNGTLRLVFESPSEDLLDGPDNITVSPRGGVVLCEDGDGEQLLRGLTHDGKIFDFALNLLNDREWAGATFSTDGKTLFVNIQGATSGPDTVPPSSSDIGMTFAIWGPWEAGAL